MIDIPLLSHYELSKRLMAVRGRNGRHPAGDGVNLKCVEVFTGMSQTRISMAMLGGEISNRNQILLSQFFHRWDRGEISFHFDGSKWQVVFNNPPVQRSNWVRCVKVTNDGPVIDRIFGVVR
jgi:hypothetical protein